MADDPEAIRKLYGITRGYVFAAVVLDHSPDATWFSSAFPADHFRARRYSAILVLPACVAQPSVYPATSYLSNRAGVPFTHSALWHDKGTNYGGVADSPERRGGSFATSRRNGNSCL
jgi:hypothetical protein